MNRRFIVLCLVFALLLPPRLGQRFKVPAKLPKKTSRQHSGQTNRTNMSTGTAMTSAQTELAGNNCARQIFRMSILPSGDAYLRTPEMITKYGYPVETHTVTTKDGYILTLYRIPYGKPEVKSAENFPFPPEAGSTRPAVLLYHGIMCTSADWLMQPEDDSLPFMLANAGYDVWLVNARGSTYSNKHRRLNSYQLKYWKFSWHEMGQFDVPKIIDYVLATTGEPKLYFVGHSMGGTVFFVTMALYPEYNDKIRSLIAMAPASYMDHIATPMALLAPLATVLEFVQNLIGFGEFLPPLLVPIINIFGPLVCAPSPVALTFCGVWFAVIAGLDPCQFNTTQVVSKIVGHTPDTTSLPTLSHYIQLIYSKKFRAFDYGESGNRKKYGRSTPPDYDLSKVTSKVAIFYGPNDLVITPPDVAHLVRELPNVVAYNRVNFPLWNHLDFTYGIDARVLVYEEILRLMAKHYN